MPIESVYPSVAEYLRAAGDTLPSEADPFDSEWFRTHGRVIKSPSAQQGDKPLIAFLTVEKPDPSPRFNGATVTPFECNFSPLRFKGFVDGDNFNGEVGITADPSVYFKLGDLIGDLRDPDSIVFQTGDKSLYNGAFRVYRQQKEGAPAGFWDIVAKVDWVGIATKVAGVVIPLVI